MAKYHGAGVGPSVALLRPEIDVCILKGFQACLKHKEALRSLLVKSHALVLCSALQYCIRAYSLGSNQGLEIWCANPHMG